MALFVDVDDTLILWQMALASKKVDGEYFGDRFLVNTKLLDGIIEYSKTCPDEQIVVWSGGGKDYAQHWITYLGLTDIALPMPKIKATFSNVGPNDTVIDDSPISCRTHTPYEWPN
jgi:hypothetical protein